MMNFGFSSEQIVLKEEIINFARKELGKDIVERDKNEIFDQNGWDKCGQLRLQGLVIPEKYGGKGLDALSAVLVLEALGYGNSDNGLNFAICAHLLACLVPIWQYGSEEQKQSLLPNLCNGSWLASNAMTEPSSGSDAYDLETTAKSFGEGFILNGHKNFCANAPLAHLVLTYASTNPEKGFYGGITAFILVKGQQEFHCDPIRKTGLRTCKTGKITMESTYVPKENILGEPGGGGTIFNKSMEWERCCLGAIHLGTMQRLLENAVKFVKNRKSGGKPLSSYQAISHSLAEMKVQLEASRLLCYRAAWNLEKGNRVSQEAAIAKLHVSENFKKFSIQLNQIYAGLAFLEGNEVERTLRDALGGTIYSGTSEIQKNIIASWMGMKS